MITRTAYTRNNHFAVLSLASGTLAGVPSLIRRMYLVGEPALLQALHLSIVSESGESACCINNTVCEHSAARLSHSEASHAAKPDCIVVYEATSKPTYTEGSLLSNP